MGGWQNLSSETITASGTLRGGNKTVRIGWLHAISNAGGVGIIRLYNGQSTAGELLAEFRMLASSQWTFGWDGHAFKFPETSPNNAAEQFSVKGSAANKRNVAFGGCFVELTNIDVLTVVYV